MPESHVFPPPAAPCLCHTPWCAANVTLHQFAESLGMAIDVKDDLTRTHSQEVAVMAHLIAKTMGLPEARCEAIHIAGHLHDIGKLGIPDQILKKEGPLTSAEWKQMREHPAMGYAILKPVQALVRGERIADMVLAHHERFDGSGYPLGLSGNNIPLGARIIAVADAMSAMIGNRHYRHGGSWKTAVAEILRCSGTHFDPEVVLAFLSVEQQADSILESEKSALLPKSFPPDSPVQFSQRGDASQAAVAF